MGYKVTAITYNDTYKVIGKHPDGRIFAVRHGNVNGLYVVDRDLNLVATLNTTLDNYDVNGLGNGVNECVILSTGTMICWGIYRTNLNQTKVYRSTDNAYANFEEVFSLPIDITFIEKSVALSSLDDTLMCCEYTMVGIDPDTGLWLPPLQLNIWKGTNDGRVWEIVNTRNRNPQFDGDTNIIRHFHTVRYDPYENIFWIGSGDGGYQCAIYTINTNGTNFQIIKQGDPLVGNGQMFRTTSFMFTEDYIWWGSDAQLEGSHPFGRLDRQTRTYEALMEPNDCIRLSDKITTPTGLFLIANKSYEKAPTNIGITELFVCDDFVTGEWYSIYSWDVASLDTVSVFYQIIDNKDGRVYVYVRRIKDNNGVAKLYSTAIMDIVKTGESGLTVNPQGEMVKVGSVVKYTAKDKSNADISNLVIWSSSNTNVATVNTIGVVTTLVAGITVISCTDSSGTVKQSYLTVMSDNATNTSAAKIHVGNEELMAIPIYNPDVELAGNDTRWRFETTNGTRCFKLINIEDIAGLPTIKVKIGTIIKKVKGYE